MKVLLLALQVLAISALPNIYQPLSENVGNDRVTLNWKVKGDTSGSYQFLIEVKEYENAQNPNIKGIEKELSQDTTRTTITELKSGTTYAATIRAVDLDGTNYGGPSTSTVFTTTGIKPPRNLKITVITDTSVTFTWSPPIGVDIDETKIKLVNNKNKQTLNYKPAPGTDSEYTVEGLEPGTPYIIQIQSVKGTKVSTITQNGLRTAVGTISRVRLSDISPTTVTTHWDAPRSETDHKINRYELELIKDASNKDTETKTEIFSTQSNSPNILSYKFTKLMAGRYYGVKVRVVYEVNGYGPWSGITFFETRVQDVPSSPTQLKAIRVEKQTAQLYWEAPTNFREIEEYEIEFAKKDQRPHPLVHTEGSSNDFVISELESGTTYTAKVRAIGQQRITGQWSVVVAFTTSGPKPVSSVSITEITDSAVKVGWTTYSDEKPTKIKIYQRITNTVAWNIQEIEGDITSVSLSGLSPTTPYEIQVTTVDAKGVESSPKTGGLRTNINLDIISSKPTNLELTMASRTSVRIVFNKVSNRLVKFYSVEIRGFSIPNIPFIKKELFPVKTVDGEGTQSVLFKNIESGWKYKISVQAIYGNNEEGAWSTPRVLETEGPRPPRFVDIIDIKDTKATVTWTSGYSESESKPNNLEYKITLYELIGESQKMVTTYVATGDKTQHTFVDKTQAGKRYNVVIVTHSSSTSPRESTPKDKAFRSNSARPEAPLLVAVKVTGIEATVFWRRIPGRGDIRNYDVHLTQLGITNPAVEQFKTEDGLEDSFKFGDLRKGFFYEYKIRAVVESEVGKWLIQTFYVPDGTIKKVVDPTLVRRTSNTALLTWASGTRPDLKMYEIELQSERRGLTEVVRTAGLTNSFELQDLHPGTTYKYKIRAVANNENEKGPWSETLEFTTAEAGVLGTGASTGTVVGIVLAIIAIVILIVIAVMIYRKRRGTPFEQFGGSVKFQKNGGDGGLPAQEMDDTATAIRNGKKLYI